MPKLTVTVITRNEARNIADALRSVAWADEIVVIDAQSTDDTVAMAREFTDRVFVREWPGYVAQKNHAASVSSHDWILSIDADERVTPELQAEIASLLADEPPHRAYRVPRLNWYLGRWVRTTDWHPDLQTRLYDRRAAEWTGRYVHEGMRVQGPIGRLRGELHHYPYRSMADHLDTINRYTTAAARQMDEDGTRAGPLHVALHPAFAWLRNYLLKGGIRDGLAGFVLSTLNAYYVFLKFAKLWERQRGGTPAPAERPAPDARL